MEMLMVFIFYIIPFLGCMLIVGYTWKHGEEGLIGVQVMAIFIIGLIPIINFFVAFMIIGSHLIDEHKAKH